MDRVLRRVRERPDVPFGGMSMFIQGDWLQLAAAGGSSLVADAHTLAGFTTYTLAANHRQGENDPLRSILDGFRDVRAKPSPA